jgi:hypothetical protein
VSKPRSALARPLDRRYPTNLAVIILAPSAGLVLAGLALYQGQSVTAALEAAVRGSLTAFAGWALARELAPDDNPAAFVSMSLALLTGFLVPSASILLVFTALMLVRIVNRSVGIDPTWLDSVAITLLTGWMVYSTGKGAPAMVAAIAFGLDATLPTPLRRQWVFAALCLSGGVAFLLLSGPTGEAEGIGPAANLPIAALALLYAVTIPATRRVQAVADLTAEPLRLSRVRAGMVVAWLMAVQGFLPGRIGLAQSALIWAVLAGLLLMMLIRSILPFRTNQT